MTDLDKDFKIKLSMLLDDELDASDTAKILGRMGSDEELRATWARYHLIGQLMRAPKTPVAGSQFADRIKEAIKEEPAVLAPRALERNRVQFRHKVVTVALAASLMGVAVLVSRSMNEHAADVFQASTAWRQPTAVALEEQQATENIADTQFSDYLVTHNETAYMAGSAGMLSYVRVISADENR
jgi:sigma-E factor negative regulatory protein RseA